LGGNVKAVLNVNPELPLIDLARAAPRLDEYLNI